MTTELPAPFTTPEDDVSDYPGFLLNTNKLMFSELWALAKGDEFKAAVGLWCSAWKQVPAGSLPNDETALKAFSGAGSRWNRVSKMAMRGFVLCSDGRLYHKTLCEDVKRAAAAKTEAKQRTAAATAARWQKKPDPEPPIPPSVTEPDTDSVTDSVTSPHRNRTGNRKELGDAGAAPRSRDVSRETPERDLLLWDRITAARFGDHAALEYVLRHAASWEFEPAPMLAVTGEVMALIDAGADIERDVIPVVTAYAPQVRRRTSWKYFLPIIAEARDDRLSAAKIVADPKRNGDGGHRDGTPRRSNFSVINGGAQPARDGKTGR